MAVRKVVWTDTARRQRREIFTYWNKRNGSSVYSKKLLRFISFRVTQLIEFPYSGKETEFSNMRITSLGHFSIVYLLTEHHINIMGFWDTRQNPDKLLDSFK